MGKCNICQGEIS